MRINNLKPHIWSLSINFRFSGRKSQSQQKLAKKVTHFTIQFRSKNIPHFTNLSTAKNPNSLYKFCSKYVFGLCQKKHLHCTISRRPRTAFLKHFQTSEILLFMSVQKLYGPEISGFLPCMLGYVIKTGPTEMFL